MRKLYFTLFFLLSSLITSSQILSNDTTVCDNYTGPLYALGSQLSNMQYDDQHDSIAVPIGFNFTFYGNVYEYLVVSGNGYVTFDTTVANTYSPWSINSSIPNPGSQPENAIMSPWHDMNTGVGGQVYFGMSGIAPNRFFIITWCHVPMYSCTSDLATHQVILYEGSNKIEMFIEEKPLCSSWNGGAAIQGLVDANSTNFDIVNDPVLLQPRNFPLQWSATNEGWEFLPTGVSSYAINQITYVPIDVGIVSWYNSNGDSIATGPQLNINTDSSETYYSVTMGDCYNFINYDSVNIIINETDIDLGPNVNIPCNSTVTIFPLITGSSSSYQYFWSNGSSDTLIEVGGGTYSLSIQDNFGCTANDSIQIFEDPSPTFDFGNDYTIPCNTTTVLDPLIVGGTLPFTYNWNDGSSDSINVISEGEYILIVSDYYACTHSDTIIITEDVIPNATISGGGVLCNDGTTASINFNFNGLLPWGLTYTNGATTTIVDEINVPSYAFETSIAGNYEILLAEDVNDCFADTTIVGIVEVIVNPLPNPVITPTDITIYVGDSVSLTTGNYEYYEWYAEDELLLSYEQILNVTDSGRYKVWVEDNNGCSAISELAIVRSMPLTQVFIPNTFTPNGDNHNELFVIKGDYIVNFKMQVFNKWGAQLFESNSIYKFWDGTFENTKVEQGSYYYNIELLGEDNKVFKKTGRVNIIH